ncbi:indolepyruvate oxidoreductase subunit beta [Desulfovibrio ferrophilus]|uniref:Indolepyruvate ferredoxin oxidoreductase n=1 Tax=Desulfovibrio ferrophilus TaxID=241368 RepID=A0A2Z6AUN7_9BACT|nr:indolepyruvate oxidoreductase subunit beta [Desulfovibrio ferrophilus]BBD06930.1 indolepyruvate ferredoxin oxidoreductase [Desulfovibrio ferrophilus]
MAKARIFFTGVGGQGTLTATIILAQAAMAKGLEVTAGEVHGMAQRGGVVESTLLIGGFKSPRIAHGEADILLGFEPLETLRALPYLKANGTVVSNSEPIAPIGVTMGRETYPDLDAIVAKAESCAARTLFLPCQTLGIKAGAVQCGNVALLGALCATGTIPLTPAELADTVKNSLKPKIVDMNLRAIELGVQAVS